METWSMVILDENPYSTVSTKTKTCNVSLCSLKKKAKISTHQILFTPKPLNFDIAKNTSLKVCVVISKGMCMVISKGMCMVISKGMCVVISKGMCVMISKGMCNGADCGSGRCK